MYIILNGLEREKLWFWYGGTAALDKMTVGTQDAKD
jgi:hypothetical protein